MAYTNSDFSGSDQYGTYAGGGMISGAGAQLPSYMPQPQAAAQDWYDVLGQQMPSFMVSDLTWNPRQAQGGFGDNNENVNWGGGDVGLGNAARYGHFANVAGNPLMNNNYQINTPDGSSGDPFAGNSFTMQMKSGDKQGTYVTYDKQGDRWVPRVASAGTRAWDSNPDILEQYAPLFMAGGMAAAPAIAAGLGAAGGAAGGAGAAGGISSEFGGMLAGGLTGGAPSSALGGLSLGGTGLGGGLLPTGAAGTLGGTFGGLTQIGATTGALGGSLGGLAGSGGAGMGTGGISSILDNLPSGLRDMVSGLPGDMLQKILPSLIQYGAGSFINRGAMDGAETRRNDSIQAATDYRTAGEQYGNVLRGMIPGATEAFAPRSSSVDTGYANATYDPATGKLTSELGAPWATRRDDMLSGASSVRDQLGSFDPNKFASDRFDEYQGLLAPQRAKEEQNLLQQLYSKAGSA